MTDATGGPDPEWANEEQDRMWFGDGEHGFWQLLPSGPMPERHELSEEEQREASTRYLKARFMGQADLERYPLAQYRTSVPWIDPDVIRGIERVTGETYKDGHWVKKEGPEEVVPDE